MVVKMTNQSQRRHPVRIVLVGDHGVGKTSIILSLVSEEFPENVPNRAEEITIPADVTPEQVPTSIVDTEETAEESRLVQQIERASVICVIYAVDDDDTVDRLTTYWMPLIRDTRGDQSCPVVLVGNKIDLVEYSTIDAVLPVMEAYSEIETCIECSAKTLKNISELFYYAQKAVLHPIPPIYSVEKAELTDTCRNALIRIFKICDIDCDGLLNDIELNNFQSRCFNGPLQPQVLDEVKAVLQKNIDDGVRNNSITLKGFLYLHTLFIQRGRNETAWTVLRKFGYDDALTMRKDYLIPHLKVPSGCTTELSHKGHQFLTLLFERFDKDHDNALSPDEQSELFSTCPLPAWPSDVSTQVVTNDKGWITYQGYMCQWALVTLVNLPRMLEYLAYLGYNMYENECQTSAVQVTREKRVDLAKKQSSRNVYQCHVIGPSGSGKTSLCRSFLRTLQQPSTTASRQGSTDDETTTTTMPNCTVNMVQVYGQEKILVLKDISVRHISDPLMPNEVQCDVACLVYDVSDPKSFEYVARIYIKYFADSRIPVLVVGCKSDLVGVKQDYLLQPMAFCQKYKILPPHTFSTKGHFRKDVFVKLATMAAFPPLRRLVHMLFIRPQSSEWLNHITRHIKDFGVLPVDNTWWKTGISLCAVTALGYFVAKIFVSGEKIR